MITDLLKWGLPLFFASSVVTPEGGNADAESIPDTAGGGAEPAADDGGVEETDQAAEADVPESDDQAASGEEISGEGVSPKPDGRALPDQVKKALAKLRETDPQAADVARRAYYEASDFKRVFPSVTAARDARDLIDSVGGAEGIQNLQGEANDYARELTAMANGDPSIVDELAKDYPESLPALVPHALEKLAQTNPAAYERTVAKAMATALRDKGVAHSVTRLLELIGDGKQQAAHDLASKLAQWISGVEEYAKSKPETTSGETAEAKALRDRQAELDRRESSHFRTQVAHSVITAMNEAVNRGLAPFLKGSKLTAQQRSDLVNSVRGHIAKGFEGNTSYQERMKALLAGGDIKAVERYIRGQLSSDRVGRSVKAIWGLRGFARPAKQPSGNGSGAATTAPAMVASKPSADQIDWKKDPGKIRFMRGEATLKTGKVVRWNWQ